MSSNKNKYQSLMSEQKKRKDRNIKILTKLENIEKKAAFLQAKTDRIKSLKGIYKNQNVYEPAYVTRPSSFTPAKSGGYVYQDQHTLFNERIYPFDSYGAPQHFTLQRNENKYNPPPIYTLTNITLDDAIEEISRRFILIPKRNDYNAQEEREIKNPPTETNVKEDDNHHKPRKYDDYENEDKLVHEMKTHYPLTEDDALAPITKIQGHFNQEIQSDTEKYIPDKNSKQSLEQNTSEANDKINEKDTTLDTFENNLSMPKNSDNSNMKNNIINTKSEIEMINEKIRQHPPQNIEEEKSHDDTNIDNIPHGTDQMDISNENIKESVKTVPKEIHQNDKPNLTIEKQASFTLMDNTSLISNNDDNSFINNSEEIIQQDNFNETKDVFLNEEMKAITDENIYEPIMNTQETELVMENDNMNPENISNSQYEEESSQINNNNTAEYDATMNEESNRVAYSEQEGQYIDPHQGPIDSDPNQQYYYQDQNNPDRSIQQQYEYNQNYENPSTEEQYDYNAQNENFTNDTENIQDGMENLEESNVAYDPNSGYAEQQDQSQYDPDGVQYNEQQETYYTEATNVEDQHYAQDQNIQQNENYEQEDNSQYYTEAIPANNQVSEDPTNNDQQESVYGEPVEGDGQINQEYDNTQYGEQDTSQYYEDTTQQNQDNYADETEIVAKPLKMFESDTDEISTNNDISKQE